MKIGLFTDTYHPQTNGVATSVGYLAEGLREMGHQVQIVAPQIKGYQDEDPAVLRIPSIRAWPTIPDSFRLPSLLPHQVWWKIYHLKLDLIHAHGNGFFSLIGLGLAKRKKIPFILTFNTILSHYVHYFLKGRIVSPKTINTGLRIFGNLSDGVITPSAKMKSELISLGVKKPITVIPHFINLDKFSVDKNGFLHSLCNIPKDHQILLSVGRLGKEKNFEFIIEVFQKIAKKYPHVHLVIVGEGKDKHHLQKLAKNLNLEKRIHLPGAVDIDLMPDVYQDADIFVFASISETQGLCVLEACASGLPLVIVDDPSYEGMIVNNKNGFSLSLNQLKFATKIKLLLDDPKKRLHFGESSRQIARSNFDEKVLVLKLINLYKNYIRKHKSKNK